MKKLTLSVFYLFLFLLSGCSSIDSTEFHGKTYEYSAWFEGESEELNPYRMILSEKLEEIDGEKVSSLEPEEYLNYLSMLDASGKRNGVETRIKEFIAKNPADKRGMFVLGVHYMRTKRRELTQYIFNSLEKEPSFAWKSLLYNNLGMLSLQDKDRDKAIGYFEKAIKSEPPIAAPRVNLASLYLQSKSYSDALPLFEKALSIDRDFEDAALGLGICLESQGKFNEAHQVYSDFYDRQSKAVSVLYNDALILGKRLGKKSEASEIMLRYIQRGGKETAKAHEMMQGWR